MNELVNHIDLLKSEMEETRIAVLGILQWSESDHFWYAFERGTEYLEKYLPGDPEATQRLKNSPMFWNWWKIKWHERDVVFAQDALYTPISLATDLYHYLHDPRELVAELAIPRIISKSSIAAL